MTPINLEMIKQLLQEFVDKEAVTAAETTVVQQQVQELEARITLCRERLQIISGDKEKLLSMAKRYIVATDLSSQPKSYPAEILRQEKKLAQFSDVSTARLPEDKAQLSNANIRQERLGQIQTRKDSKVSSGQNSTTSETITGDHPLVPAVPSLNFQASKNTVVDQGEKAKASDGESLTEVSQAEQEQPEATNESDRSENKIEEPAVDRKDEANKKSDSLKESVDDTVKSINDALRGLFR